MSVKTAFPPLFSRTPRGRYLIGRALSRSIDSLLETGDLEDEADAEHMVTLIQEVCTVEDLHRIMAEGVTKNQVDDRQLKLPFKDPL